MIPYEIDPSLYTAEPESPTLDDGFSPPAQRPEPALEPATAAADVATDNALGSKGAS